MIADRAVQDGVAVVKRLGMPHLKRRVLRVEGRNVALGKAVAVLLCPQGHFDALALLREDVQGGLATPVWTLFSETEAGLPELDRAHVAKLRVQPEIVVPVDVVVQL